MDETSEKRVASFKSEAETKGDFARTENYNLRLRPAGALPYRKEAETRPCNPTLRDRPAGPRRDAPKIPAITYAEWKKMGFSRRALFYLKKSAWDGKPFTMNKHVRERLEQWRDNTYLKRRLGCFICAYPKYGWC